MSDKTPQDYTDLAGPAAPQGQPNFGGPGYTQAGAMGPDATQSGMFQSYPMGVLFASVVAVLGALLWYALLRFANMEHGILAWGIGLGAGAAMLAGAGRASKRAGLTAAGIGLGGILLGKALLVYVALFASGIEWESPETAREEVIHIETMDAAHAKNLDFSLTTPEQDKELHAEAVRRVSGYDEAQLREHWQRSVATWVRTEELANAAGIRVDDPDFTVVYPHLKQGRGTGDARRATGRPADGQLRTGYVVPGGVHQPL